MKKLRLVAAALVLAAQSVAAGAVAAGAQPASPQGHALTADDLDAFFDGYMPLALERGAIAGSVVAVVKDGQVIFEKGYGVSNVKKQTPVDPKTTMFRIGSISKLFTWTAVMQLAEQHKVDLDTDVNTYLDFKIPPFEGKPITLRNLMTHTPGFEETDKGLFVADPKKMVSLEAALKASLPARVFPPGEVPAYSNYGAALAGYIVQRLSGETFEDYIANHILTPLGMEHTTFDQPLPERLRADMSKGYKTAADAPEPYELIPMSPAGSVAASADDMTRFMLAHLNNGTYGAVRILQAETATKMHGVAYEHTPGIPPMAYGFYRDDRNGHLVIAHGGDTLWFHSDLHLILDSNVGIFVSQNSMGKPNSAIRGPLYKSFMDRYFPAAPLPKEPTLKTAKADGALVAGDYIISRGSFTNILAIAGLFGQAEAKANDDGTLSVDALKNFAGDPMKFHEVRPFVWREVHGSTLLMAKRANGQVTEIVTDDFPQILSLLKAPLWKSQKVNLPLFLGMLIVLALTVIFWPVTAVVRWNYSARFPLEGRAATLFRLTRLAALCYIVLFCGVLAAFTYALNGHLEFLSTQYDWLLRTLQAFGVAGVLGTIAALMNAGAAAGDGARPWYAKAWELLAAVACLLAAWYAIVWHLLVWNLNY